MRSAAPARGSQETTTPASKSAPPHALREPAFCSHTGSRPCACRLRPRSGGEGSLREGVPSVHYYLTLVTSHPPTKTENLQSSDFFCCIFHFDGSTLRLFNKFFQHPTECAGASNARCKREYAARRYGGRVRCWQFSGSSPCCVSLLAPRVVCLLRPAQTRR